MFNVTLSLNSMLIIMILTFAVISILYCCRCWILRNRRITMADVGLHVAFAVNCVQLGLCSAEYTAEKRVRDQYSDEILIEAVFIGKKFLVVRDNDEK